MQVKVYRNLHKQQYSVMDAKTRLVQRHAQAVLLANVTFRVSESGRQRVLQEKRKNVHAFVCGQDMGEPLCGEEEVTFGLSIGEMVKVSYNPYKGGTFVRCDTFEPVHSAEIAWVMPSGVYIQA